MVTLTLVTVGHAPALGNDKAGLGATGKSPGMTVGNSTDSDLVGPRTFDLDLVLFEICEGPS